MTFAEFKKSIRPYKLEIVYPLENLTNFDAPIREHATIKDPRSFIGKDGFWHIYPVAFSDYQVYIICPLCGDVHVHGHVKREYKGSRSAHCVNETKNTYVLEELPTRA